ncbi:hypothetical protein [Ferrigenium sp. UT5]|uniref:hypothetical protein n=1 Tax=Ferrigenium sp. UT5 TaxID=3242105 RepID=UPI00354DECFF
MSETKRKVLGVAFKAKVGLETILGLKTVNQMAQEQVHGVDDRNPQSAHYYLQPRRNVSGSLRYSY